MGGRAVEGSMPEPGEVHQAEGREPGNQVLRAETRWPAQRGLCHRAWGGFQQPECGDKYRGLHLPKSSTYCRSVTRRLIVFSVLLVQGW